MVFTKQYHGITPFSLAQIQNYYHSILTHFYAHFIKHTFIIPRKYHSLAMFLGCLPLEKPCLWTYTKLTLCHPSQNVIWRYHVAIHLEIYHSIDIPQYTTVLKFM